MKYLIVDDNLEIREMIHTLISCDSDSVRECADGSEAVETYKSFHPDYVTMDIEMPGKSGGIEMDGFMAAEKIHEYDENAKIIFVTDYNTPAFRRKADALHATGFVGKENLMEIKDYLEP